MLDPFFTKNDALLKVQRIFILHNYIKAIYVNPVVPWLSYLPLDPRFAGSNPVGLDGFFSERKNPEYDFLQKGSKAVGLVP